MWRKSETVMERQSERTEKEAGVEKVMPSAGQALKNIEDHARRKQQSMRKRKMMLKKKDEKGQAATEHCLGGSA